MNRKNLFASLNPSMIKNLTKSRFYDFPFFIFPASKCIFKVNNSNTRTECEICSKLTIKTTASMTSFWCLYCWLRTYFTSFSSVSFVDFVDFLTGAMVAVVTPTVDKACQCQAYAAITTKITIIIEVFTQLSWIFYYVTNKNMKNVSY